MRLITTLILICTAVTAISQKVSGPTYTSEQSRWSNELPSGVIFYEGFENASIPALPNNWSSQSVASEGFITGTSGNSPGQANSNGYWPVPAHGIYAMSNDDVCNCNKSFDRLISSPFDASGLNYLKMIFSAFQNGSSSQEATVEVKSDGGIWTQIFEIPASSRWEDYEVQIPVSNLKSEFQFRFRYNDNGNYASGLAIDDIILFTNPTSAFELEELYAVDGDVSGSGQGYELMPLGQAQYARLRFGAKIKNDSESLKNARLKVTVDGPISYSDSSGMWNLPETSSEDISFTSRQRFTPYLPGDYEFNAEVLTDSADSDLSDNVKEMNLVVGDSIYARLENGSDGTGIWLSETGERVGSVFQFFRGDTIRAVKVHIHPASTVGSRFRIKLFSYDTLTSSIYSSSPIQIEQNDLGTYKRIELNENVGAGKVLLVLENESGSAIFYSNTLHPAENGNALSFNPGSPWKSFPYFIDVQIVMKEIDETCPGHFQYEVDDQSCPGVSDGKIKAEIFDANLPWTYSWSNGAGNVDSIDNLNPGTYQLIVTDGQGCVYEKLFQVRPADSLAINPIVIADSCGSNEGSIDLNIGGGTGPFSVLWNGTSGLSVHNGLEKGNYSVDIIDNNGCSLEGAVTVPGTDPIGIAFTIFASGCNDSSGFASITPFGTGPFSYSWSTGSISDTITDLPSGVYSVTMTDSIGCQTVGRAYVPDSNAPAISLQSLSNIFCPDSSNGAININVSGGTPGYSFQWSNGSSSEDLTDLASGTYELSVSDANGCKNFFSRIISNESAPLILDLYARGNYCDGDSSGKIQAIVDGGSPLYTFQWSNGSDSSYLEKLPEGFYALTVTDNNGCQRTETIEIASGNGLIVDVDSIVYDTGGSILPENEIYVSAYGGIPPYTYTWNDSIRTQNLINVDSSLHTLVVRDQLGCRVSIDVNLTGVPQGITEENIESVWLYPNPLRFGQELNLSSQSQIDEVDVVNLQGQTVYSIKLTTPLNSLRAFLPPLHSGAYLVRITTEGRIQTKRLLFYQ